MTADELRDALHALGLRPSRFAKNLGIAESTATRWVSGETRVAPYVPYVIKLLRDRQDINRRVKKALDGC